MLAEVFQSGRRSLAVIGLGKNTGKTFTLNHLLQKGQSLGLKLAVTTIGLDGEERDLLFAHKKPPILVEPGQVVATAESLLRASNLDYQILAATGMMTALGEVIIARVQSRGRIMLAGPAGGRELQQLKKILEETDIDFFLVDGAADRRSLAAPLVTDLTILAAGAEAGWERSVFLARLGRTHEILTLPGLENPVLEKQLRMVDPQAKAVLFSQAKPVKTFTAEDFFPSALPFESEETEAETVFIQGMFSDEILQKVLALNLSKNCLFVVADSTAIFLSDRRLYALTKARRLQVLDPIVLGAVTISSFHSRRGYADPYELLQDAGQAVAPVPCFDLALGLAYQAPKEDADAADSS